jgi:hypothetical protein
MARKIICAECGREYELQRDRRGDTERIGLREMCKIALASEFRPHPFPVRRLVA